MLIPWCGQYRVIMGWMSLAWMHEMSMSLSLPSSKIPYSFRIKNGTFFKGALRTLGFTCGLDFSLNPQPFPNTVSLLCMPNSCSRPSSQQLLLAPPVAT